MGSQLRDYIGSILVYIGLRGRFYHENRGEEVATSNSNDAICMPIILLPPIHSGVLCLTGGSFMVAVLMIIWVGRCFL